MNFSHGGRSGTALREVKLIRYDTVYLRALKSWRDRQLSLAHGTETKKIRKTQKTE